MKIRMIDQQHSYAEYFGKIGNVIASYACDCGDDKCPAQLHTVVLESGTVLHDVHNAELEIIL